MSETECKEGFCETLLNAANTLFSRLFSDSDSPLLGDSPLSTMMVSGHQAVPRGSSQARHMQLSVSKLGYAAPVKHMQCSVCR